MYEHLTYEFILKRMLSRAPADVDKREGSIIYDALAPAAAELARAFSELDALLDETFADTAGRENLIRRAAERGVRPDEATCAVWKGEFNMDIPQGSRFSLDDLNFIAESRMDQGVCRMRCETAGRIGNTLSGSMIPVDYIDGLTRAELTELLIPGEDEESTESLRQRYFDSLDSQAFGGNRADYRAKINDLPGVGGVKLYRAWNGGGTVRAVIINSEFTGPSPELTAQVQEAIDPQEDQGDGLGLAPMFHCVTVEGVGETEISVAAAVTYQEGWSWEDVREYAEKAVDSYFAELAASWQDSAALVVRISQIETRLLNIPGVLDITGTTINGAEENLVLDPDCIPKRGGLIG